MTNKWDGVYSLPVDQLCKEGGFEQGSYFSGDIDPLQATHLVQNASVTMDQLKKNVIEHLKAEKCKKLYLASIYKMEVSSVTGPDRIYVVCQGVYE